ncbi:alanine racemase [Clostridium sp.]|uniref:alanine racemase n=1 Tax=Clostridium sp. TaxID=1506 RepID=UPI002FC8F81B
MFKELRPVWAEIDLDAIANNMREIRRISTSKEIIAIIKADGYGHGAIDIAPVLLENGADRFGVAVITEAIELRNNGINVPIMVLGFTPPTLYERILEHNIEQTIYNYNDAEELSKIALERNKVARIHIAIDTGMGRIGFLPNEESAQEVLKISELPNVEIIGLFTHFSSSDDLDKTYSMLQIKKYNEFNEKLIDLGIDIPLKHLSNSAATMDLPIAHYNAVRPGIILYGCYPSEEVMKEKVNVQPVMSIKANIVHIKTLTEGEYISYGRTFKTERESVIATLPIGYADGFTRLLFGKAKVIINGKFAPVVGRICMDQCMIDITDIDGVKIGDEVILIGADEFNNVITADDIAKQVGTINYEVVCAVSKRVPRVYKKGGKIINIRNYV